MTRAHDRIVRLINSSLEIEEVLRLSMKLLERTVGATASSILIHDPAADEFRFYVATGEKGDALEVLRMPADQGVAGRAFQTGRTLLIPEARRSKFFYQQIDDQTTFVTRNLIATPIRTRGKTIGVCEVLNKARGTFTPADARALKAMTSEIAVAIENARLHDDVKRAYIDSMLSMARAERLRDRDTGQHIDRCGEYAVRLGPALGFAPRDLENLRVSIMMHDIGKVAIPDAVLLKPARLDAGEFALMQTHTVKGAEILGRAPHLQCAVEITSCHHEKWDGTGYPGGLRGEAIPLAARLTAIIDVFDALTSRRPYKDPFPPEQVESILREGAGSHFDPRVCEIFLGRIAEMREVFRNLSGEPI